MPTTTHETPTTSRTFSNITFAVPAPFAEGHALTAGEAGFLNTQVGSVVGNAYSGKIRRAVEAAVEAWTKGGKKGTKPSQESVTSSWDHAAEFAAAYADYQLGVSNRGGGGTASGSDPIARIVTFLNTEDLKARILAKGLKVRAFQTAPAQDPATYSNRWAELQAQNLAAKGDAFRAQAEAQHAALVATDTTSDALFDTPTTPETQAAE